MIVSMNKKIFVLWGFIVVGILLSVLLIGINEKDLNYMKFEYTLKLAGKAYIKDNNIKTKINESYVIFNKDLKNKNYVNNEDLDKYCINKVTYYNGILFDKYTISRVCENDKE